MLVVGLGGGSLPLFIHDYFSQACVAVVEIDPSMLEVATCWFGFSQGDRMRVHISDGLDYVAKLASEGTFSQTIPGAPSSPVGDVLGTKALGCFHPLLPVPAHLLSCVMSSSLIRSLQLAGLSLPACAGDLRFAASPSAEGSCRGIHSERESPEDRSVCNVAEGGCPKDPIRCLPTMRGSPLCHGIISSCTFSSSPSPV